MTKLQEKKFPSGKKACSVQHEKLVKERGALVKIERHKLAPAASP